MPLGLPGNSSLFVFLFYFSQHCITRISPMQFNVFCKDRFYKGLTFIPSYGYLIMYLNIRLLLRMKVASSF